MNAYGLKYAMGQNLFFNLNQNNEEINFEIRC